MAYLHRADPAALPAAWRAFRCFERYGEDVQEYARATRFVPNSCEDEVVGLLQELLRKVHEYPTDGREAAFAAEQNALVLKNAEAYYRTMVREGSESWNLRDRHMTETLERLMQHHGPRAKAIVWEHNTHIGDARFTDMADEGGSQRWPARPRATRRRGSRARRLRLVPEEHRRRPAVGGTDGAHAGPTRP
jgi:erythromycin esterase